MEKNKKIIDEFNKLIKQVEYEIDHSVDKKEQIRNTFRLKQIKQSLRVIKEYPDEILSGAQLAHLNGVGKGTVKRIDEILQKGRLSEVIMDNNYALYDSYVEELESVIGIGRKTAFDLIKNYDIKSVKELTNAYKKGKVELNDNILMGLKYHNVYKQSIPRDEILEYDTVLHNIILEIDAELFGVICGSYRRLRPVSNDIDFMIVHPNVRTMEDVNNANHNYLSLLTNKLEKRKIIVDSLTSKDVSTKYMGFCRLDKKHEIRRIDIRFIPYESYYTALLYFTGPGDFNKKMRNIAIDLGYLLSEYGLYKVDEVGNKKEMIPMSSEKAVFDALSMEYITPENRR